MEEMKPAFEKELAKISTRVEQYIMSREVDDLKQNDIRNGVLHYTKLGGKRLRPAAVLLSCGAVNGDQSKAVPLAAAVELYHTWTLIHDDIIDQDLTRRFGETVHAKWGRVAAKEYGWRKSVAQHYGLTVAILAGDMQKGWAVAGVLPQLFHESHLRPELVLKLIEELDFVTLKLLVDGEALDVLYSREPLSAMTKKKILDMLWKKTGALYRFCGMGGAMVGLETTNEKNPLVQTLANFTSKSGIAFQIQDDILGIVGKEKDLGKPVGSDIREGKRTLPVWKAYTSGTAQQKRTIQRVLGNRRSRDEEIREVVDLIRDLGGIRYGADVARAYIEGGTIDGKKISGAIEYLEPLPHSKEKELLGSWAEFLVNRRF